MTLINKLELIKTSSTLPELETGYAKDFDELWKNLIEPNLPKVSVVQRWHEVLTEYIKRLDVVFFVRAFGSYTSNKKDKDNLRRGYYNTTDHKFSIAYCDNFFTSYFYSMAYDNYCPAFEDFEAIMKSRKFPCGFLQTKEENEYAAFFHGKNPNITNKGYKIAHIYSAGENYNETSPYRTVGDFCDALFPRGANTEWAKINNDIHGGYHYRHVKMNQLEANSAKAFAIAHFIRTVHPINYFLVPKKSTKKNDSSGIIKTNIVWNDAGEIKDEIGEDKDLINYVSDKIKDRFSGVCGKSGKDIYSEFLDLIYPIINNEAPKNKIINADYGIDIWNKHETELSSIGTKKQKNTKKKNNISTPNASASKKSTNKNSTMPKSVYEFNGVEYVSGKRGKSPRNLLLAIVDKYLDDHPNVTYEDLMKIFDLKLDFGKKYVIRLLSDLTPDDKSTPRVFISEQKTLSDGNIVVVNNQVTESDMPGILLIAQNLGYNVIQK